MMSDAPRPRCMEPGCPQLADCLPKLWVPAHPLSPSRFTGVASVMGLPMCFTHFKRLRVRQLLEGEGGARVRASISEDFRKQRAIPWFEHASLHYVRRAEPEFANWIDLHRLHRELSR